MSAQFHTLYQLYLELSDQYGKNTLHDKMWERYGDSESPGYNAFMCLLNALETCQTEDEFVQKASSIIIYSDGVPILFNIDDVAYHMVCTLFDIRDGIPMKGFLEW